MIFIQQLKKVLGCKEDELQVTVDNLEKEITEKDDTIQLLKKELMIKKEAESLTPFERYLKQRFPITRLIYKKRYMISKPDVPITYDVRDYLQLCFTLSKLNFQSLKEIWQYPITYVFDENNQKFSEFWQLPQETSEFKAGDCEDSSLFRIASARLLGETGFGLALGFYHPTPDQNIGHAFPVWFDKSNNKVYIIEATNNTFSPVEVILEIMKSSDNKYDVYWIICPNECFVVNNSIAFGKQIKEEFQITNAENK